MLEIDDSKLTAEDREYLQEWANNLGVGLDVLLGEIVLAAVEGDTFIKGMPETE